jgi:hypothetical protein
MEIRIVVFLFLTSIAAILNTVIIFGIYRMFAGMTAKMTDTVSEMQSNAETRQWLDSLQVAAENAAKMTEATKVKIAEFDPVLTRAHENYRQTLAKIDSKLDQTAEKINTGARDVRDVVSKPAFAVATFAAGVTRVMASENDE